MAKRSTKRSGGAWKAAEKAVAKALRGVRILRGADFSIKDVDVRVRDFPGLIIDSKYRQRWAHHAFVNEIIKKYCKHDQDMPILITKAARQSGAFVTLKLDDFGLILDAIRELREEREDGLKRRTRQSTLQPTGGTWDASQ